MTNKKTREVSCSDCGTFNCYRRDKEYPPFCLTTHAEQADIERIKDLYKNDELVSRISNAAAEIEGMYYGKLTRVEETIAFAKRIGAKKIGVATCVGLTNEAKTFVQILNAKGLESFCVVCKAGSIDKTEVGIPEDLKVQEGCHESLCNPVLQAEILNQKKTDLNVIVGLCVGHDSLFIKYSEALVTTLLTKDRVLGHNPAAALYTTGFYYGKLLKNDEE